MDASDLPSNPDSSDSPAGADQTGLRSYFVEGRFGFAESSATGVEAVRSAAWGLRSEYRRETLNYGEWLLQADTRNSSNSAGLNAGLLDSGRDKNSSRITLRNLGAPITPTMFADTSIGDIYSEVTDALSRNYRLSLGSSSVRGVGTRIFDRDFDLRLGIGERGALVGGPYPGFERSQGTLAWAGYTQRLTNKLFTGIQVSRASNVQSSFFNPVGGFNPGGPATNDTTTSAAASVGYGYELPNDGDKKARLTLLSSNTSNNLAGRSSTAHGIFAEGGAKLGRFRHELGAYQAGPDLRFGDYALAADNRGAYWRVDHSGNRQNWGGGLDYEQTNPGQDPSRFGSNRLGVNGNFQYRLGRDTSFGGNFSLNNTTYTGPTANLLGSSGARSINASAYYATRFYDWGGSRFNLSARRNESLVANDIAATGEDVQWEHDWIAGKYETMRPEFITTLGLARDRSSGETQTYPTAGVIFKYWADPEWSIAGNLRYTSRTGNLYTSRGLSGSLSTERSLGQGWLVGGSLSLNQATVQTSGANFSAPQLLRSNETLAFVYLRWQGTSGAPYQSAGLRNPDAAGTGGVSGVVYFDANRDGEQQSGEGGAPNVEVILDQRYRVLTDRNGQFEFPLVSTGRHQLTMTQESIPLPWGAGPIRSVNIEVPLRGQVSTRIPVVRVGD